MRTTIRLNDELARKAREFASRNGQTFTQLVEEAILDLLNQQQRQRPRKRTILPVVGGKRQVSFDELKIAMQESEWNYDLNKVGLGHAVDRR